MKTKPEKQPKNELKNCSVKPNGAQKRPIVESKDLEKTLANEKKAFINIDLAPIAKVENCYLCETNPHDYIFIEFYGLVYPNKRRGPFLVPICKECAKEHIKEL